MDPKERSQARASLRGTVTSRQAAQSMQGDPTGSVSIDNSKVPQLFLKIGLCSHKKTAAKIKPFEKNPSFLFLIYIFQMALCDD